jgi:hypothetical protein
MKIREGFVSNSSTTSFCIYGAFLEDTEEIDEEKAGKLGLEIEYDDYGIYVGKSWPSIKDDQTGGEFKKGIEDQIAKLLGKKVECETHEEASYNG